MYIACFRFSDSSTENFNLRRMINLPKHSLVSLITLIIIVWKNWLPVYLSRAFVMLPFVAYFIIRSRTLHKPAACLLSTLFSVRLYISHRFSRNEHTGRLKILVSLSQSSRYIFKPAPEITCSELVSYSAQSFAAHRLNPLHYAFYAISFIAPRLMALRKAHRSLGTMISMPTSIRASKFWETWIPEGRSL